MKKIVTILVLLVLVSLFLGTLFFLYAKSQEKPVVFRTEAPAVRTVVQKTVATGSVVPRREVEIKPQVSGIVEEILVEAGDRVETGQLIARIRIIPDMVSLANAQNRVSRALIDMNDARRELERQKKLRAQGTVSASSYEGAQTAFDTARQELSAARDNLELIQKGSTDRSADDTNTVVRATIAGMVLEIPLEKGDSVIESNTFNEGTTIATVADMDELVFMGKVDESEVGKLREGMELLLTIGAIEEQTFTARLEHIAPKGREENGAIQFEIRAALDVPEGALIRANYSATADIVLDRRNDVLAVREALLQFDKDDDSPYVEIETAPQTYERREIVTGLSDGIWIEVVEGLSPEARVKHPEPAES